MTDKDERIVARFRAEEALVVAAKRAESALSLLVSRLHLGDTAVIVALNDLSAAIKTFERLQ